MGQEEKANEFLESPILKIVENSDVSIRLRNAIKVADGNLPFNTLGDYLAAGPNAIDRFLSLQNLGRKSAKELDALLRSFASAGIGLKPVFTAEPTPPSLPPVHLRLRTRLLRLFSKLSFPEIVTEFPTSTRLNNVLRAQLIETRPFSEFLADPSPVYAELLKLPNLGRTSVSELQAVVRDILTKFLHSRGLSPDELDAAVSLILNEASPIEALVLDLESLSLGTAFHANDAVAEQAETPLFKVMIDALSQLDERTRIVLERRYGINQSQSETLEQISTTWNVTRERVRQIEAKGLRQLTLPSRLRPLKVALKREALEQIVSAAHDAATLHENDRPSMMKRLPPTTRLAIDIVYRAAPRGMIDQTFLKDHCKKWKNGWLLGNQPIGELNELLASLKARLRECLLPVSLDELLEGVDRELGATAVQLGTKVVVFEGYVAAGRVGPRRKRTIRLHSRLSAMGSMQDIRDLLAQYHRSCPSDRCSVRDAEIVMSDAPHLFLRVVDENWRAIGRAPAPVSAIVVDGSQTEADDAEFDLLISVDEEANIASVLRNQLVQRGPQRFVDLRTNCASRLGGRSINSLGPILLTSGMFVRPLPGIYALAEQLPSSAVLPFDPPKFLLSEEQAKWFAMARHSAEPFGLFPLWTPAAEYALCRWSQTNASRPIYRSLLAVSTISEWPVAPETREHWFAVQRKDGMYELEFEPRYPLSQLMPPLDRVLAATVYIQSRGGISWISANRILKRRLDASVSAGLLALLVLCGAVKPSGQWQGLHEPGPALGAIRDKLSRVLHGTGILDWRSPDGKSFLEQVRNAYRGYLSGWVTEEAAEQLLAGMGADNIPATIPSMDEDEPMNALEALLQEHKKRAEKTALDSTFATLLG